MTIVSDAAPVAGEALQRGLDSLLHRGPDGQGTWFSPDRRIALGHVRLSIIDLATGAQPIANEDETLHIAVNGEFYGFESQRRALEARGHRFRTHSDSEIALHLFEDLGVEAVHQLRGEFAFTLWDQRGETLYAFRDRYGIKPLYYSLWNGALYIASEMKALFACGVPARWDAQSIALGAGLRGAQRTLFDGVFAVPPGHYLACDQSGLRLVQYWDIDYPRMDEGRDIPPEEELVQGFRRRLDEAVALRLRADVPVACYLSGGLDSCALLGLASRLHGERLRSFTLRFTSAAYDEGAVAAEMAALAGSEHSELAVDSNDLAEAFADSVIHAEAPANNSHGIAKFLLSRAVRDAGYKVVLTGEGADEVLFGYPHFRQDMLLQDSGDLDEAERQRRLQDLRDRNAVSLGWLVAGEELSPSPALEAALGFVPSWLQAYFAGMASRNLPLDYGYLEAVAPGDPASILLGSLDVERRLKGRRAVEQSGYLWAKTMLPNYMLAVLGDRSEMAHSIEGRVPFLDHEVGQFLDAVPLEAKIRGRVEKHLLRLAVRDVVTDRVFRRQKHPFLGPPVDLRVGSRFYELAQDTLRSAKAGEVPFLNVPMLWQIADQLPQATPQQRISVEPRLLYVMSILFLQRRFAVGA